MIPQFTSPFDPVPISCPIEPDEQSKPPVQFEDSLDALHDRLTDLVHQEKARA
jgi:hypothetical protein